MSWEHGLDEEPITLRQLHALLAISDAGSISAAARELKVTQPVLSRIIGQLERSSGVSLVSRSARGTALTAAGQNLATRARSISAELRRCHEDIRLMRGESSGRVSIACSPVPMMLVTPIAIRQFLRSFPQAEVRVTELVYPKVVDAFRNQRIDFAIGPVPRKGLGASFRVEPLFQVDLVVAAARDHPAASARTLSALRNHPWLIMGPDDGPGAVLGEIFASHHIDAPHSQVTLDTVWSALEMIRRSGFVGFIPRPIAESAREQVRIIRVREALPPLQISLIAETGTQLTSAARALISAVRARSRQFDRRVRD